MSEVLSEVQMEMGDIFIYIHIIITAVTYYTTKYIAEEAILTQKI